MMKPFPYKAYHIEEKTWGREEWIVNTEMYCGKILTINEGRHTSMHFHANKHETMYCLEGEFVIEFLNTKTGVKEEVVLKEGESVVITPYLPHSIHGLKQVNRLIEFSTHHENSDSYRVGLPG